MSDRLPHEKGFHISWDQIHRDSRALAWRLEKMGPDGGAWKAIVAITRGGMAPAMAKELKALQKENGRLKKMVAEQALDMEILKEAAKGNF